MTLPIQKVWMARTTRAHLKEYAYVNRTSMGDIIRAAVEDVRDNPGYLGHMHDTDERSEVQVSVKADDELFNAARESAHGAGLSFNSMVRRRIRKLLADNGYI